MFDKSHNSLVERGPEALDYFDSIKCDIGTDIHLSACNYMSQAIFTVNSDRVGISMKVPIDNRYQITELALSTGDIFL
jgi:hypothetical protein